MYPRATFAIVLLSLISPLTLAEKAKPDFFDRYFRARVTQLEKNLTRSLTTKEAWLEQRPTHREQLAEMLGLHPLPPRTDLKATKTGEFEHDDIIVEKLHYQSLPGLYVTANLYRPKNTSTPVPAVLYLCGHADKKSGDISYGNKTGYEHHGVWYAKNGIVCLVIDTVQLGEIRGEHHGTHRLDKWWWLSRGYTPAGVEAWAGIRGLDYLETRPEVDGTRFGVTGRSGGGAYSWWVAALDERVKCAAPTAGITNLHDHVVKGHISGHCDCMYLVNNHQWDYDKVASLIAPRPLLITNTDKDPIFPIEGVYSIFLNTRKVYRLLDADKNLGFHIAEGGHTDVQPLNTGEFHWMLRHLKDLPPMGTYNGAAVKSIAMEQLKVFDTLPADQRNTTIDRTFVPIASISPPTSEAEWTEQKTRFQDALRREIFHTWPTGEKITAGKKDTRTIDDIAITRYVLSSDKPDFTPALDLHLIHKADQSTFASIDLAILDTTTPLDASSPHIAAIRQNSDPAHAIALFHPRGTGPTTFEGTKKEITQFKRRFYLLGESLEANQVADIRNALNALASLSGETSPKLSVEAASTQAANALYASLFAAPEIRRLTLRQLPHSHMEPSAPAYLNILKHLDIPQAVALAADKSHIILPDSQPEKWTYPVSISKLPDHPANTHRGLNFTTDPSQTGGAKN